MVSPHKCIKNESFLTIEFGPSFCNYSLFVCIFYIIIYSDAIDIVFPKIGKIGHFLPSIANTKDFHFKRIFFCCHSIRYLTKHSICSYCTLMAKLLISQYVSQL